uniref:Uncharacterized protein n=1 Tax=Anguilla anguilla TaxID=7936 RepID=A0A0E9ST05_ANGAN
MFTGTGNLKFTRGDRSRTHKESISAIQEKKAAIFLIPFSKLCAAPLRMKALQETLTRIPEWVKVD